MRHNHWQGELSSFVLESMVQDRAGHRPVSILKATVDAPSSHHRIHVPLHASHLWATPGSAWKRYPYGPRRRYSLGITIISNVPAGWPGIG